MTARIGILQKIHEWVAAMSHKNPPVAPPREVEEPLHRLERLLVGIVCSPGLRDDSTQVVVDALNADTITCKCRQLMTEGSELQLNLLLQGVGNVKLSVQVDWVLMSSHGHTVGLKVLHDEGSREILDAYLQLVRSNARG